MNPDTTVSVLLVAGVVVILVRILVGIAYERRTSRLWTFGLPTLALLVYFTRAIITRITDFDLSDWAVAATLGFVILTQFIATIYQWWPTSAPKRRKSA